LPKATCDTSPLQYLHQLELLHVLPALTEGVIVPPAVVDELATGRALGVNLPDVAELDWISVRHPLSAAALPLVTDLGPGEAEVPFAQHTRDAVLRLAGEEPS
jgi:predicted nucleic acid-binding protein